MNKTRNLIIGLILVAAIAAGGFWLWQTQTATAATENDLEATGVIEARTVNLSPEVGGQVMELFVEEGERVTAGQPLLRLDDTLLATQRAQALAAVQAAEAQLALLQAGARDEQIAVAEAQLAQAEAGLRLAEANLALLQAGARDEQIVAAEAQLAGAEANWRLVQANLNLLTAGTEPGTVAATQASLDSAWDRYNNLRVILTTDQLEAMRAAVTTAEDNLATAVTHQDDHVAADTRNPDYVLAAFAESVLDAETAVSLTQQAYDAAQNETIPYVSQVELARQSWELAQTNSAVAQARYDGLAADDRTTSDALDAAQNILDDAGLLETAVQDAYETLTSGSATLQLTAVWNEVQRLQAQLAGYALAAPGAATPSVETLLTQMEAAAAQGDMAAANLDGLLNGARAGEIEAAQAQVDAAIAQRDMAAANLDGLLNGARSEEVAMAQAGVDAAQAQLDALDVQLAKYSLTAPWDGILLTRSAEPGETVLPGGTVLEIGRLDRLELTVYLAEDRFGLVTAGQTADVRVDAYPDRVFTGTVLRVADEAEFTPTNIQTKDDRVRLVYAVTISLDNADLALKPGMIADATFGE
jgi:membrane fusion protein YbhG